MTEKPQLQLIQGGYVPEEIDWVELLENMDVKDALPILRRLTRQRKAATNSALSLVDAGSQEGAAPAHAGPDTPESTE